MTSNTAKATFEKWKAEGLQPTFDDIITLNDYGLRLDKNPEVADFARAPRHAYLGEAVLREPSVWTQMWLDKTRPLIDDGFESQLFLMAFALACPIEELPRFGDMKALKKSVKKFAEEYLADKTVTQIMSALEWCISGAQPDTSLLDKDTDDPRLPPMQVASTAREIWMQAIAANCGEECAKELTVPELERMLNASLMYKGVDILKSQSTKALGDFYVVAGKIHKRLVDEKNAKNEEAKK